MSSMWPRTVDSRAERPARGLRRAGAAVALVPALLAGACAFTPVQDITAVQQPKAQPVRNVTSFSESLRCMDELLRNFGVNDIVVTSAGIPDATGEIKTGTKEMLISAISQMSVESNAFRFVDFDQSEGSARRQRAVEHCRPV